MKILKIFGTILFIVTLLIVGIGLILPAHWTVERSIVINAPSEKIYPYVANFKTGWKEWSAFDYEDPSIVYTYSGPDEGAGAFRSWTSKKMGDGSQTIIRANPQTGIDFVLRMDQNKFTLKGKVILESDNSGTKVTWRDEGDSGSNPFMRIMGALMDKMMGETFEKSLATLKEKVEHAK